MTCLFIYFHHVYHHIDDCQFSPPFFLSIYESRFLCGIVYQAVCRLIVVAQLSRGELRMGGGPCDLEVGSYCHWIGRKPLAGVEEKGLGERRESKGGRGGEKLASHLMHL